MRVSAFGVAVAVVVAPCVACGQPAAPAPSASSRPTGPAVVAPADVMRVRSHLPPGYEVADLPARATPLALWGFDAQWTAEPPGCGILADPAGDAAVHGFSASGPGGIVYVVVADAATVFDPAWADPCGSWTLAAGRASGAATLVGAPAIDGAATVGTAISVTTVVEGGTETHSHADTFVAYLDAHVVYAAVVTDPGASSAPLGREFAADLLVESVSAIRG